LFVVRCLASMVALRHAIKPTVAIESAAVSPKAAQVGAKYSSLTVLCAGIVCCALIETQMNLQAMCQWCGCCFFCDGVERRMAAMAW
jgi:hypothetical protein